MGKEGCISQGSRIISFGEGVAKQEGRSLVKNLLGPWNSINDYLGPKPVASLVAELVKNLPAMQETWIRSLGWEDPLEKGMATHSSILAWKIPWTEEPGRLYNS